MDILQIDSRARIDDSQSTKLANAMVDRIRVGNPEALQNGPSSAPAQTKELAAA